MCRFNICMVIFLLSFDWCISAEKKLTHYMLNKLACERAVKIYLAFEARHDVEPGIESDLNLPKKAKFRNVTGDAISWIYPVALGLEVKIGSPQRRVVIIAPASAGGRYLIGTDDLVVKSYTKKDLQKIYAAIDKRREKLSMKSVD